MYRKIAKKEMIEEQTLILREKQGKICIIKNKKRDIYPLVIGEGTFTKVNANIGTSKQIDNTEEELKKLDIAIQYGADAVMDLSTGKNIDDTRKRIIDRCPVALGTVPVYQLMVESVRKNKKITDINEEDFLNTVIKHAEQGVDFATIHTGLTLDTLEILKKNPRTIPVVSRGGSFILEWMKKTGKQNPFFEYFDELIKISKKYDIALSLGDGMRPGCLKDASDNVQIHELNNLCIQAKKCVSDNVKVFIEGPGHIPIDQIKTNVQIQKTMSGGVPFYVLGPLVTDIAPGYDHITGAIGGALAASYGVDFLCYVTPAEHLRLPTLDDVRLGVISSKIAAHAADIVKKGEQARKKDDELSEYRRDLNWNKQKELVIDKVIFDKYIDKNSVKEEKPCTLCGDFCAMKEKFDNEGENNG
jgi:phosphomethylpyrimidine synthase